MRIGTITFHCAYNFGSALQTYALRKYLTNLGHDVHVIDYRSADFNGYKIFRGIGVKSFIADFYKYGFVGIMLDWIDKGMQEDYHKIVMMMGTALDGNIARSIENFKQK